MKRVREFGQNALIIKRRDFLENFESELLRGISSLTILSVINEYKRDGTYGYQISKDLQDKTGSILYIEDGTLYPILKKFEKEGVIESEKKVVAGRSRTYYRLTDEGVKIFNHLEGFMSKLIEAIAPLLDIEVSIKKDRYVYCTNCANKIDIKNPDIKFCDMCGLNIEDLLRRI